jgi:hypothetical protein
VEKGVSIAAQDVPVDREHLAFSQGADVDVVHSGSLSHQSGAEVGSQRPTFHHDRIPLSTERRHRLGRLGRCHLEHLADESQRHVEPPQQPDQPGRLDLVLGVPAIAGTRIDRGRDNEAELLVQAQRLW